MAFDSTQLIVVICLILSHVGTWHLATSIAEKHNPREVEANKKRKLRDREKNTLGRVRNELMRLTEVEGGRLKFYTDNEASYLRLLGHSGAVLCTVTCNANKSELAVAHAIFPDFRVFHIEDVKATVQFAIFGN